MRNVTKFDIRAQHDVEIAFTVTLTLGARNILSSQRHIAMASWNFRPLVKDHRSGECSTDPSIF